MKCADYPSWPRLPVIDGLSQCAVISGYDLFYTFGSLPDTLISLLRWVTCMIRMCHYRKRVAGAGSCLALLFCSVVGATSFSLHSFQNVNVREGHGEKEWASFRLSPSLSPARISFTLKSFVDRFLLCEPCWETFRVHSERDASWEIDPNVGSQYLLNWLRSSSWSIDCQFGQNISAVGELARMVLCDRPLAAPCCILPVVSEWPPSSADTRGRVFASYAYARFTVFELLVLGLSVHLLVYFLKSSQKVSRLDSITLTFLWIFL